jgi:two-component system, sensor histidine kinase and response regulator
MKKVLIIEDEESLRNNVAEILALEGFEALTAANGRIGLALAQENLPDLVVCDVMMPEMDGFEVLSALRENQATRLIPFILLTAMAERENIRKGMELGADDYIIKPFGVKELLHSVNSRLRKSEAVNNFKETALNELRMNLISQLPHELRTPLNGIIGFGQLLQDNAAIYGPNEMAEFGEIIKKSGMRLYRLIQNYLIYAQLELKNIDTTQKAELDDAGLICKKTAEEVADRYNRKNDLIVYASPCKAAINHQDFTRIVEELTDNAFKFSEAGTRVTISCGSDKGKFRLTIEDAGRGMTAENIKNIGAYMQFDRMLYAQQGSGLGLIISKRIAELYGGILSVENTSPKGIRVTVMLPEGLI